MKQYLPSRKFVIVALSALVVFGVVFGLVAWKNSKKIAAENQINQGGLQVEKITYQDLVSKDTDGDGIEDWEESLWGTDPNNKFTQEGTPDASLIEHKKKSLGIGSATASNTVSSGAQ